MKKSLFKQIALLISLTFVANCIGLFTVTEFSLRRANAKVAEENQKETAIYANNIEARLKMEHEHLYTLVLNLYENNGITKSDAILEMMDIKQIYDEMDRRIAVSDDLDVMFLYDTVNNLRIFRANENLGSTKTFELKNMIFDFSIDHSTSINTFNWNLMTVGDDSYFYESAQVGKYRIGYISSIAHYKKYAAGLLDREEVATFINYGSSLYFLNGDSSLRKYFGDDFKVYNSSYVLSQTDELDSSIKLVTIVKNNITDFKNAAIMIVLVLESLINVILILLLNRFFKYQIEKPLSELLQANDELISGNLKYRFDIEKAPSLEFSQIEQSYNDMVQQIGDLKIQSYEMQIKEEQNRLRLFRAQVKPHTFLNGITTISNMTYTQDSESIRNYINSFAKFTRYMLHTTSEMTSIANEIEHVKNYIDLQRKKSAVNIELNLKVEDEVKNVEIPFLMIYSLVENSIKHSLVNNQDMIIYIQCRYYETENFKGVMIVEEDNGKGFSEEKLQELSNVSDTDDYAKEHLGLTNVKYTLNLLYKRNDLLQLSNNLEGSARIVILIPWKEEENETINM